MLNLTLKNCPSSSKLMLHETQSLPFQPTGAGLIQISQMHETNANLGLINF